MRKVDYDLLGCDFDVLNKNEQGECLIEITPSKTQQVNIRMDYEYSRCGADMHSVLSTKTERIKLNVITSCSSNADCLSGYTCCSGWCRDLKKGFCDDLNGDGIPETWISYY
ncbi:MAG: hypothetical protein QXQ40_01750 [Candidatus Aenigmatarchaeota archaeon]